MFVLNTICALTLILAGMYLICVVMQLAKGKQAGMARIILSGLLNDIRNAMGSMVFSAWKGINYVREKASSVSNPNSADQANIRARLTALSKRWYATLTQGQRDLWEEYAQAMGGAAESEQAQEGGQRALIPDNRGKMSGFNAFIMLNSWAYSAAVLALGVYTDDAPAVDAPNAPTLFAAAWDTPTCCLTVTWTDPEEPPTITDGRIRVWLISTQAGVHKQLVGSAAVGAETLAVCSVNIALGMSTLIYNKPGFYLLQADFIDSFGQKSPPTRISYITVPAGCTPA